MLALNSRSFPILFFFLSVFTGIRKHDSSSLILKITPHFFNLIHNELISSRSGRHSSGSVDGRASGRRDGGSGDFGHRFGDLSDRGCIRSLEQSRRARSHRVPQVRIERAASLEKPSVVLSGDLPHLFVLQLRSVPLHQAYRLDGVVWFLALLHGIHLRQSDHGATIQVVGEYENVPVVSQ